MNDATSRRFAERDRVLFEFDPASFELVTQKRNLDHESFEKKTSLNNGGLVVVHRRTSFGVDTLRAYPVLAALQRQSVPGAVATGESLCFTDPRRKRYAAKPIACRRGEPLLLCYQNQ